MKFKKISAIFSVIIIAVLITVYYTSVGYTSFSSNSCKPASLSSTIIDVYTCSMHPDVISDKPGSCPKCGMDLVKKEDNDKDKNMNIMKDCMDKCKEKGCNMENCKGESGSCKDCKEDCKNMMKMDDKKMDKDCKMGNDKDCKSGCMKH